MANILCHYQWSIFWKLSKLKRISTRMPLRPYLFIIAINELICRLQDAILDRRISGIKLTHQTPPIHSLLFADDFIICGQVSMQEAQVINHILQDFCDDSGQVPNWDKSAILFSSNTPSQVCNEIKNLFQIPLMNMSHVLLPKSLIDDLNGIIRHFWWKGNSFENNNKPLCLSAWEKFCIPKGAGGLGFRDLCSLNEALITGLA